jgi:tetratricopeptide (TPR) repeat protein
MIQWFRFLLEYPIFGPLVGFLVILYQIIRHRRKRRKKLQKKIINVIYDPAVTFVLAGGALILAGYYFYRHEFMGMPRSFSNNEVGIVIAPVPGDDSWRTEQQAYDLAIQKELSTAPDLRDVVKVRLLERPLSFDPAEHTADIESQSEVAQSMGRRLKASFVLVPYDVGHNQAPWLASVGSNSTFKPFGTFADSEFGDLDRLPLPRDLMLMARSILAQVYLGRRQRRAAIQQFRIVLASPQVPDDSSFRSHMEEGLGIALIDFSKDEARAALENAVRLNPDAASAHNTLGAVLVMEGKNGEGIQEMYKAVRLSPKTANAHGNICSTLERERKYMEALDECASAVALDGNNMSYRLGLGAALSQTGATRAAAEQYRKAIALRRKNNLAHTDLGRLYERESDFEDALVEFMMAEWFSPQSPDSHSDMCLALIELREMDKAISECKRALAIDSHFAPALFGTGVVLYFKGDYQGAISAFQRILDTNPNFADAHYGRGVSLKALHRDDEANVELSEAARLDPSFVRKDTEPGFGRSCSFYPFTCLSKFDVGGTP